VPAEAAGRPWHTYVWEPNAQHRAQYERILAEFPGQVTYYEALLLALAASASGASESAASGLDLAFEASLSAEASAQESRGWNSFLDASIHSARSLQDRQREDKVQAELALDRSIELRLSDDFVKTEQEQAGVTSLHDLAREQWAGLGDLPAAKAAQPPLLSRARAAAPPPPAGGQQVTLRTLLQHQALETL